MLRSYLILSFLFVCFGNGLFLKAQPTNNTCQSATPLNFGLGGGYEADIYNFPGIDITNADVVPGEYFDPAIRSAGLNAKSVWYTFDLPTSRELKINLSGSATIGAADAGFTLYYADYCTQLGPLAVQRAKLAPINKLGNSANECLDAGTYYIQVSGNISASGELFISIELDIPFLDYPDENAPYNLQEDALYFDLSATGGISEEVVISCQSIMAAWEFEGLPTLHASKFNRSIWGVGKLPGELSLSSIILKPTRNTELSDSIFIRVIPGDVSMNPLQSSPDLTASKVYLMKHNGVNRFLELNCSELDWLDSIWSFQILVKGSEEIMAFEWQTAAYGGQNFGAVTPLSADLEESGVLNITGRAGITDSLILPGFFTCDFFLDQPSVNCSNLVHDSITAPNGRYFDLNIWYAINLTEDATIHFIYEAHGDIRLARLFRNGAITDCEEEITTEHPIEFQDSFYFPCMPAGEYLLQLLSYSGIPEMDTIPLVVNGPLGRPAGMTLLIDRVKATNDFNLSAPERIGRTNNNQPMVSNLTYEMPLDTFACTKTVLPQNYNCTERNRAIYRTFKLDNNSAGLVTFSNLRTQKPDTAFFDFVYKVYQGDLSILAAEQNAFLYPDIIDGSIDMLDSLCIQNINNLRPLTRSYCFDSGEYTLVTLGDSLQIGKEDFPTIISQNQETRFASRLTAEVMGNVDADPFDIVMVRDCETDPFDSIFLYPPMSLRGEESFFSCRSNPETIGGLAPCLVDSLYPADKLIYRTFYVGTPRVIEISCEDTTVMLNFFIGKADDPNVDLQPYTGPNSRGQVWEPCFTGSQSTKNCDTIPYGWYTVVAYGYGPSFDQPYSLLNPGSKWSVGEKNTISISAITPSGLKRHHRPNDAFVISCEPINWDFEQRDAAFPQTRLQHDGPSKGFGCTPDLPWSAHAVIPCRYKDGWSLYGVFSISDTSFLRLSGIADTIHVVIYPFDVRTSPELLMEVEPVHPCSNPSFGEWQLCNLLPGDYSIVFFAASDELIPVKPEITLEKTGKSRFDHAFHAYDFGLVPQNNEFISGKPGDFHPIHTELPASTDFIYCSTGAAETDPLQEICLDNQNIPRLKYNPNIYKQEINNPLYLNDEPTPDTLQKHSLRNLWYTFQLSGNGSVELEIDHYSYGATNNMIPRVEVYASNKDGALSFEELKQLRQVDSTLADGLTFIAANKTGNSCSSRRSLTTFDKTLCNSGQDTVRFYVLVTMWYDIEPNQQVSLRIKYDGTATIPVRYDHYSEANVINGLQQISAPYDIITLQSGTYIGAPASLACATRDSTDPYTNSCYNRSVWYKFYSAGAGTIRIANQLTDQPGSRRDARDMRLYRETIPGDSSSLMEVPLSILSANHPTNQTGHRWRQGCIDEGVYYIFWVDCLRSEFNPFLSYQPVIMILESKGSYCQNAVEVNVPMQGIYEGLAIIDCHTIGNDFGEDGSNMNCLSGPENQRSTWFKFTISGNQKMDLNFRLNINGLLNGQGRPLNAGLVSYRMLYGDCSAMTSASCASSGQTSFTFNCLLPGSYYLQVITPDDASGDLRAIIDAVPAADQGCIPLNPNFPFANFEGNPDCDSDWIQLRNFSTSGDSIQYEWILPDGTRSHFFSPHIQMERRAEHYQVEVGLIVTNIHLNWSDTVFKMIDVLPQWEVFAVKEISKCYCLETTLETEIAHGTQWLWSDGSVGTTLQINQGGIYSVEVLSFGCLLKDTIRVTEMACDLFDTTTIFHCRGELFEGVTYTEDTYLTEFAPDSCGNTLFHTINLKILELPTPEITGPKAICNGETVILRVPEIYSIYNWSDGQDTSFIETSQIGKYFVSVVDEMGCKGTDSFELNEIILSLDISEISNFNGYPVSCYGLSDGHVTINPGNGIQPYNIIWEDGYQSFNRQELSAGIYHFSIADAAGCTLHDSIILTQPPPLFMSYSIDSLKCFGDQDAKLSFQLEGGVADYFIGNNRISASHTIDGLSAGSYHLQINDLNNCRIDTSIIISQPEELEIYLQPVPGRISLGDTLEINVQINLSDPFTVTPWNDTILSCLNESCDLFKLYPLFSDHLALFVQTEKGCNQMINYPIFVEKLRNVFIPNAFTPNGDGNNDFFTAFTDASGKQISYLQIFDRWGNLIWETKEPIPVNDSNLGWDGTRNGIPLNPGTYVYSMEIQFIDGHSSRYSGSIHLLQN